MNEIESLIVRLTGDGSEYQRMLKQAENDSEKLGSTVERLSRQLKGFHGSLSSFASLALSGLARLGAAVGLFSSFQAFSDLEKTNIRLKAAIESTGRAAEPVIAQYKAMADELEKTTLQTSSATMGLFRMAETQGIQGAAAERAVSNAIALAGATDMSAEATIRATIAMERGNYHYAQRLLRLQGVKDKTDLLNQINQKLLSGQAQQEAMANTTSGALQRLQNSLRNVGRELGGIVAQAIRPFVDGLQMAVNWFKQLDPTIRSIVVVFVGLMAVFVAIGPWLGSIASVLGIVGGAFTALMSPIGLVIAGIGVLVAIFATNVGGLANAWKIVSDAAIMAWNWIKSTVSGFITWAQPIFGAFMGVLAAYWEFISGLVTAYWSVVSDVFSSVVAFISQVWSSVFGNTKINWNGMRDIIRDCLIGVEFGMRTVGRVIDQVWSNAKLRVLEFRNLFGGGLTSQINAVKRHLLELTRAANETWAQFRARRIREIAAAGSSEAQQTAARAGARVGAAMIGGAAKEIHKFDAALAFSAEAVSRIEAYMDRLKKKDDGSDADGEGGGGGGGGAAGGLLGGAGRGLGGGAVTPNVTGSSTTPSVSGRSVSARDAGDPVLMALNAIVSNTGAILIRMTGASTPTALRG